MKKIFAFVALFALTFTTNVTASEKANPEPTTSKAFAPDTPTFAVTVTPIDNFDVALVYTANVKGSFIDTIVGKVFLASEPIALSASTALALPDRFYERSTASTTYNRKASISNGKASFVLWQPERPQLS